MVYPMLGVAQDGGRNAGESPQSAIQTGFGPNMASMDISARGTSLPWGKVGDKADFAQEDKKGAAHLQKKTLTSGKE